MRGAAVAGLIVALLVGAGAGYLIGIAGERSVTSVSTSTLTSTVSIPGLQLFSSATLSLMASGANLTIVAGVYNPLDTKVTVSSDEISNPSQQPCGLGVVPAGIRIYSGHYTYANVSTASPLLLYNSTIPPPCTPP